MSAAENKAVFLSYASQDAAAVARLADALRAAGVEVWFDQNELVGGDAWDAKIRKQIAECALFVPIISAATQARLEGYFRIEWKLAARRTHAMATAKAFLLPIVIDTTRDADAHVPDEFRDVQWTRLPGGEAADKFCARVKALLNGEVAPVSDRRSEPEAKPNAGQRPALPQTVDRRIPLAAGIAAALVLIFGVAGAWRWRTRPASGPAPELRRDASATTSPAAAPLTEAGRLVAKAWEQMDKTEMARNELLLAEGFCKQAAALEETNPAVWAAWSAMNTWYHFHGFELLPARKEAARDYAQKALAIDPKSYEARYAWAHFIVRLAVNPGEEKPALPVLRELLRERPDEPRALYALGFGLVAGPATVDEGFALLERLAEKHPWFAGRALNELGWTALFNGRFATAESAAERAVKAQPYWNNLGLKATLALRLHGEVALAQTMVDRLPPSALQENWGVSLAVMVADWRGDYSRAVSILQGVSRDWLENFFYPGPTSFLAGWMRLKAKQVTAAEKDFRRALELIAPRLDKTPNDPALLYYKAEAQRLLGMREEAEKTYRQSREVWPSTFAQATFESPDVALAYVRQMVERGYTIDYFPPGWWFTTASLRHDPMLENVRRAPGFDALLKEVEAREKQRWATSAAASANAVASAPRAPDKSVAVLAFDNLSDDKANEYFSDGISGELNNALSRLPGLTVRGQTSALYFKGRNATAQEIGEKLGVAYLVRGSVRKLGNTVRIIAQLSRAATDEVVWSSEPITKELKDVFAVQDEIVGLIAKNLSVSMGVAARTQHQVNPEALTALLEGRHFWVLRTTEGFARARQLFNRAVALDPQWAPARAALANLLTIEASFLKGGGAPVSELMAAATREANRAIELDATLAEPHAALGKIAMEERRLPEAEQEFRRALALEPNNALVRDWYADLAVTQGRLDVAIAEYGRALELEPLSPYIQFDLAWELMNVRRYSEALALVERAAAFTPTGSARLSLRRARLLLELGRKAEAEVALRAYLEGARTGSDPQFANEAVWCLNALGAPAERDRWAAELLRQYPDSFASGVILLILGRTEQAYPLLERFPTIFWQQLYWEPVFDAVRDTPRFSQLLEKLGCAEEYKIARATHARLLKENGTGK